MKLVHLDRDPIEKVYEGLAADAVAEVKAHTRPTRRFRASETSQCRRRIWYRLAGFRPTPSEPWLSLVADSGGMHHDYARYIANHYGMGLTGFKVEEGRQVEEKYSVKTVTFDHQTFDMSAQADAGIEIEVAGQKALASVEIKSMSYFAFDKVQRAFVKGGPEGALQSIKEDHINYIWQGNATAVVKDLDYVYLLLVGRSGNNLGLSDAGFGSQGVWDPLRGRRIGGAVWQVEPEDRDNLLQKLADINRALENGDPPPPDFVDGSTDCNQCPFWRLCHGAKKRPLYPVPGVE